MKLIISLVLHIVLSNLAIEHRNHSQIMICLLSNIYIALSHLVLKSIKDHILICLIQHLDKLCNKTHLIIEEGQDLTMLSMLQLIQLIPIFIQLTIQPVLSKTIWHMIGKIQLHLLKNQLKKIQERFNITEEKHLIFTEK